MTMIKEFTFNEEEIQNMYSVTRHTVRIKLDQTAMNIKDMLKYVPDNAIFISCGKGDSDTVWELIFEEQK